MIKRKKVRSEVAKLNVLLQITCPKDIGQKGKEKYEIESN